MVENASKRRWFLQFHLGNVVVCAGASFAVCMALALPRTLNAVNPGDSEPLGVSVGTPSAVVDGVSLNVVLSSPTTKPAADTSLDLVGKPLNLVVNARNAGTTPAKAAFVLRLEASAVVSPMSRTPTIPTEIWKQSNTLSLAPGESKSVTFSTAAIPADRIIRVMMGPETSGPQVLALTLTPVKKESADVKATGNPSTPIVLDSFVIQPKAQ